MLLISFGAYVMIINRNTTDMTIRQKILRAVYPAFMWMSKKKGKPGTRQEISIQPPVPFYSLKALLPNGSALNMETFKGKKILLVNTASDCGYTPQLAELEKLYKTHKQNLVVLAFPSNDFKEQEKGSDEEIKAFCSVNYGVTFPLMKKSTVLEKQGQNEVFNWLTHASKNGWNDRPPEWNFSKYLVDENGMLIKYFSPSVSPLDKAVLTLLSDKK